MFFGELPIALRNANVALQERAGGHATCHTLDRDHGAFLGHERGVRDALHVRRVESGLAQDAKHLAVGRIRDGRLALELVRLDAIAGRDAVLVLQQTPVGVVGQLVHHFGFALDDDGAQRVFAD